MRHRIVKKRAGRWFYWAGGLKCGGWQKHGAHADTFEFMPGLRALVFLASRGHAHAGSFPYLLPEQKRHA